MTTIWSPAWMPTLQGELGRVRELLGENAAPLSASAEEAAQALRQASDALMAGLLESGLDTELGWRLHQLRSRLDAHLLAASALADAQAAEGVVSVLRRALSFIEPELQALSTDASR
jgi:hypothetical protein